MHEIRTCVAGTSGATASNLNPLVRLISTEDSSKVLQVQEARLSSSSTRTATGSSWAPTSPSSGSSSVCERSTLTTASSRARPFRRASECLPTSVPGSASPASRAPTSPGARPKGEPAPSRAEGSLSLRTTRFRVPTFAAATRRFSFEARP